MRHNRRGASRLGVVIAQAAVLALIGVAIGVADSQLRPVNLGITVRAVDTDVPRPEVVPPTPRVTQASPDAPQKAGEPEPAAPAAQPPQPVAQPAPAAAFRPTPEADLAGKRGHITLDRGFEMHQFMGAVFLDARNAEEFGMGHIEGAHFAPLSRFRTGNVPDVLTAIPADFPIVVYCGGGDDCQASEDVALHLNSVGFFNVHVLHDGYTGWKAMGYPTQVGGPQ